MRESRFPLLALAGAYTLFVIYGSLVPLDYRPHPWHEAVETFRNIRYLNLGIGSRADWVANILLFVPLAFLWLGTLWHMRSIFWRMMATLTVLVACAGLSLGIEFTQIFFPPRTVSQNDIIAESLGALIGTLLWWTSGTAIARRYLGWRSAEGPIALSQRLLYGYLFVLFGYNVLPLDLTISPVELFHKWREGRVVLIPFSSLAGDLAQQVYAILADILVWVPAGALARLTARRGAVPTWLWLSAAALVLELLQLFVYTRVTDTTDILTGSMGSAIGVWIASRWVAAPTTSPTTLKSPGNLAGLALASLFWLAVIYSVFWYPFNFRTDGMFVVGRLGEAMSRVPFTAYYFGTEYRAVTEVLHKIGFFFPLGMLLALLAARIPFGSPRLRRNAALLTVACIAGSVEAGQLFLPDKIADPTDWILELLGGWMGWALAAHLHRMPYRSATDTAPPAVRAEKAPSTPAWRPIATLVVALALTLLVATQISAVPYNVRDLVDPEHRIWSALLLSCAVFWIFGFPALATIRLITRQASPLWLPTLMLLHIALAWTLLRLAVPMESLHDIVGSPVLDWPWEWELIGRFSALFACWSCVAFGSALIVTRPMILGTTRFLWLWACMLALVLPVAYIVVIQQAATDNLTELIAGNGSPIAAMWILLGMGILSLAASQMAAASGAGISTGMVRATAWGIASFPLTYFALNNGLEPYIMKYDQVFSAFQFLLSRDRSHYATPGELLLRYGIAHAALLSIAMASQFPTLQRLSRQRA